MKLIEGKFNWDSDDIKVDARLSLLQGERVRVMILAKKVSITFVHLVREKGNDRPAAKRCVRLDELKCERCVRGDTPTPRFGVEIIRYGKTGEGKLTWEVMPWLFGRDKFSALRSLVKKGVDLQKTDLEIYCYNETFQRVQIKPASGDALIRRVGGLKEKVVAALKEAKPNVLGMLRGDVEPPDESSAGNLESFDSLGEEKTKDTKKEPKKDKPKPEPDTTEDLFLDIGGGTEPEKEKEEALEESPAKKGKEDFEDLFGEEEKKTTSEEADEFLGDLLAETKDIIGD